MNPGDSTVRYTLPSPLRSVTFAGGGAVPDSGRLPPAWGSTSAETSTLTLEPRRAAVLLH